MHTWGALGFGYAEVGTVTAQAQPGNPPPRMFRLPDDRALLNRLGFNNHGAGELALRLARHTPDVPIGVNIGKTKIMPAERAVDDYAESARLVGPLAAYLVVNVSSPNTPGLRDLQAVESLRPILAAVLAETSTPVLVKIAPDLSDSDIDEIADLAVELGLAGIVATNTTVSRDGLATPAVDELGPGGISGPPVARRSAEVLRRLYGGVGDRLVLISVGGIETADDAWDRITSGASLLQGYTGFVYGGGLWAKTHSRRHRPPPARAGSSLVTPSARRCALVRRWRRVTNCDGNGEFRQNRRSAHNCSVLLVGAGMIARAIACWNRLKPRYAGVALGGQIELLDVDGVHRDDSSGARRGRRRGGADEPLQAGVVGQSHCVAGQSAALPSPTPAGRSVTVAGRLATAQCQKPDAVGASGSYTVTAKLRVSSGKPDQLSCGETSSPPAPMMPLTWSLDHGCPSVNDSEVSVNVGSFGR